jgi:hypothetical protein
MYRRLQDDGEILVIATWTGMGYPLNYYDNTKGMLKIS